MSSTALFHGALRAVLLSAACGLATAQPGAFEHRTGLRSTYLDCYQRADLPCVHDEIREQSARVAELTRAWQNASASGDERRRRETPHTQWLAARDAYCEGYARTEGGDNVPLAHADCVASVTASRALALRALIEAGDHASDARAVYPAPMIPHA